LLTSVEDAVSFVEDWLDTSYPFEKSTHVLVEGLPEPFYPFGSLSLIKAEVLYKPRKREERGQGLVLPEGDLPAQARLTLMESLLHGWVQTAVRLEGAIHQWIIHGVVGYLLSLWAGDLLGEEERQFRLWRSIRRLVTLETELGGASICPPEADNYILETVDPALVGLVRLKAPLIMHLIETKVTRNSVKQSLGLLMLPLSQSMGQNDCTGNFGRTPDPGSGQGLTPSRLKRQRLIDDQATVPPYRVARSNSLAESVASALSEGGGGSGYKE
ncbi:unnamed protein product, partial [Discosporangium mesarthrocarpum]